MSKNCSETEFKQLWGGKAPPVAPEEIDLLLQMWQKIQSRRQREQQIEVSEKQWNRE